MIDNERFFNWVENFLNDGKNVQIKVRGTSMRPLLRDNRDIVELKPYRGERLRKHDIVLFKYHDIHVLHRIIRTDGDRLTIQGDGVWASKEHCTTQNVVAVVVAVKREGGKWRKASSILLQAYSRLWVGFLKFLISPSAPAPLRWCRRVTACLCGRGS